MAAPWRVSECLNSLVYWGKLLGSGWLVLQAQGYSTVQSWCSPMGNTAGREKLALLLR